MMHTLQFVGGGTVKDLKYLRFFLFPTLFLFSRCYCNAKSALKFHYSVFIMSLLPGPRLSGIINQGSTCYLSSVIQMLFHIPRFRWMILSVDNEDELILALKWLFTDLQNGEENISTADLTAAFGWGGDEVSSPHDAHELIQLLFDRIEKQLKGNKKWEKFIQQYFCGTFVYRSQDKNEGYVSDRLETFYDLEVVVKDCNCLRDSIKSLISTEKIEGVKVDIKPGVKKVLNIDRSLLIYDLPPVLMVHPKRVTFDTETYELCTINTRWEFNEEMSLEDILSTHQLHLDKESREVNKSRMKRVDSCEYVLHSILIHSGSMKMGHYYTFVKLGKEWVCFNDEQVSYVSPLAVFKSAFGAQSAKSYGSERASVMIYINKSCLDDVLSEQNMPIVKPMKPIKKCAVDFFASGICGEGFAEVDNHPRTSRQMRSQYTVEELYGAVAATLQKQPSSFRLVILNRFAHQWVEKAEDLRYINGPGNVLVAVPTFTTVFLRITGDRSVRATTNSSFTDLLRRVTESRGQQQLFVVVDDHIREVRERDAVHHHHDYFLATSMEDVKRFISSGDALDSRRSSSAAMDAVLISYTCNGKWSCIEDKVSVNRLMNLEDLQERVASLLPNANPACLAFLQGGDWMPFPCFVQPNRNASYLESCLDGDKHHTLYFTELPMPYASINSKISIVVNLSWGLQPRVYLAADSSEISLQRVVDRLTYLTEKDPSLKRRIQKSSFRSSRLRLLEVTGDSGVEEVLEPISASPKMLYVVDVSAPLKDSYHDCLVLFRFSQSFIGVPTYIPMSTTYSETGEDVIKSVVARFAIPSSVSTSRWMVFIEEDGKLKKVALKETLKSKMGKDSISRIIIDRPVYFLLDGVPASNDSESLVISE